MRNYIKPEAELKVFANVILASDGHGVSYDEDWTEAGGNN